MGERKVRLNRSKISLSTWLFGSFDFSNCTISKASFRTNVLSKLNAVVHSWLQYLWDVPNFFSHLPKGCTQLTAHTINLLTKTIHLPLPQSPACQLLWYGIISLGSDNWLSWDHILWRINDARREGGLVRSSVLPLKYKKNDNPNVFTSFSHHHQPILLLICPQYASQTKSAQWLPSIS